MSSTILYALDALTPTAFLVWMRMAELSRLSLLPDDDHVLARLCRITPLRLAKARDEICSANLAKINPTTFEETKRNLQSGAERMRRLRARKASHRDGGVTGCDGDVTSHVTRCDAPCDVTVTGSDAQGDGGVTQKRGSSLSPQVPPAPPPNPNPILPKEGINSVPACERPKLAITPAMLAEPEIQADEIIPPDPSVLRSAVSGLFGGVSVCVAETTTTEAATGATDAEEPSRPATPFPNCRADAGPALRKRPIFTAEFDLWWRQVPRRVGKGAAQSAYTAARKKTDAATLMAGICRYAQACEAKGTEPQFICHPTTWLRQERWTDEEPPDTVPARGPGGRPPSPLEIASAILDRQNREQQGMMP